MRAARTWEAGTVGWQRAIATGCRHHSRHCTRPGDGEGSIAVQTANGKHGKSACRGCSREWGARCEASGPVAPPASAFAQYRPACLADQGRPRGRYGTDARRARGGAADVGRLQRSGQGACIRRQEHASKGLPPKGAPRTPPATRRAIQPICHRYLDRPTLS